MEELINNRNNAAIAGLIITILAAIALYFYNKNNNAIGFERHKEVTTKLENVPTKNDLINESKNILENQDSQSKKIVSEISKTKDSLSSLQKDNTEKIIAQNEKSNAEILSKIDSKAQNEEIKKNYVISDQDNNARGILLPPNEFPDGMVNFDLGGTKGNSYDYNMLKNGNPGQPPTHENYKGIHVLTYHTPTIKFGSALSFHISDDNYLNISAKFYNNDGELVGAIKENKFISIRKNQISWNFDDKGIEVIDDDFHVNLLVDYTTGGTIKIRGILGYPDGYFILTDNVMSAIYRDNENYKEILRTSKQQITRTFEYFGNDWFGKRLVKE